MSNTELIRIRKETKILLNKIKLCESETYEEVIQRLIKENQ